MAQHRTREEWLDKALEAIDKNKLIFISDIAPLIGLGKTRFYELELEKEEELKELLLKNKIEIKSAMRNKWFKSDNATLQMGLYKLLGSQEEYHRLSNTRIDITTREEAPFKGIDLSDIEEED